MSPENILLTADNCRYCLMCRHVCPVAHVTRLETLTPHGWGLLISSERRGLISWNESSVDRLYSCADCGTCRAHCVTDQPLPYAIAVARAQVVDQRKAPETAYAVDESLRAWGNPYREQLPEPVSGLGDVALFVGDDACWQRPDVLDAALLLLKGVGIEPVLVGVGRNSGYLASSLGFPETARQLAAANLADIRASDAHKLLVLTPGDYYAFSQLYEERLGIDWPRSVIVEEVTNFLAEELALGHLAFRRSAESPPYAYVDPPHSLRVPDRHDAPRKLLTAIMPDNRRELFWRRDRAHPVGSSSLQYVQPDIATDLTYARLGDANAVGAELIITEDPGALHALDTHAARFRLRAQGLYELLAAHLGSETV
ncbi:MAG: (Fe-S)-binding protein [Chloroflexota bacterium]|nr:(Fe-S)-binding protein [Chloroflexota bacterium]